jgi:hypothetical protein
MQFRHDRRRRVLADELSQADSAGPLKEARLTPPDRAEIYLIDAHRNRQPRLVDFVPRRNLTFFLLGLSAVLMVSALEALLIFKGQFAEWLGAEAVGALDVTARTSIASWVAALLLGLGAVLATMIYRVRRCRVDDYHRRYRVWLLVAVVAVLFSVNQTAPFLMLGRRLFTAAGEASGISALAVFGGGMLSLLLVATLRLWFELRRCRSALTFWLLTTVCFAGNIIASAGWVSIDQPVYQAVFESTTQLLGLFSLLLTFALYERYVLLEAEGRIAQKPVKERKRPKKVAQEGATKDAEGVQKPKPQTGVRTDLEPVAKQAPVASAGKEPAAQASAGGKPKLQWDSSSNETNQHLSRAERKKLKRDMRRQAA